MSNPILPFALMKGYIDKHGGGSGSGAVDSVNGQTGEVNLDAGDIMIDGSAQSPKSIAEELSDIGDAVDDVVVISDTQPQSAGNKLWIRSTESQNVQVPTVAEMNEAIDDVVVVSDTQPQGDTELWIRETESAEMTIPTNEEFTTAVEGINRAFKELDDTKADVIIASASGSIASFADGADDMPLKSCVVSIEPVQSGSGDPAPDNVRPITGWTGANVQRTGKNLFDYTKVTIDKRINITDGTAVGVGSDIFRASDYIRVEPNTDYTLNFSYYSSGDYGMAFYDKYKTFISGLRQGSASGLTPFTFTTPQDAAFIRFTTVTSDIATDAVQCEKGSSSTAFEAYKGTTYPISWSEAGTVYGGYVDPVKGELVVDRAEVDLGTLTWEYDSAQQTFKCLSMRSAIGSGTALCSHYPETPNMQNAYMAGLDKVFGINMSPITTTGSYGIGDIVVKDSTYETVVDFTAAMSGVQLVYELAEPQTYHLTPVEIRTILGGGINNIWADCGDTAVQYPADTKMYVDGHGGGVQIEIDTALSGTSTNPVQNKVIKTALDGKEPKHDTITVSGTTPSITGVADTRYVCGEVSTLTIVPPASGCIDVVFTSGTTPTVLTVTPPTGMTMKWANGFDPTALDADTVYEINILDGCLGVVGSWT